MAPKQKRIQDLIEQTVRGTDLLGATVVSRDGITIVNNERRILAPESFGAMSAALMSAAETAFYHLGGGRDVRVMAETDSNRLIAVGANDELLLIVLTRSTVDPSKVLPQIEEIAGRIRAIMSEA